MSSPAPRIALAPRERIHVLAVDDSAVVRQMLQAALGRDSRMTVETAPDPLIAINKMARKRPDVVVLDVTMPRMDGLTFLRKLMAEAPLPVVIFSAAASRGTDVALQALSDGAVEIVAKPSQGLAEFFETRAPLLIDAVLAAANARIGPREKRGAREPANLAVFPSYETPAHSLIAFGASTGGPDALTRLLQSLSPASPPIVVVQHMPAGFTASFARRLDRECALNVREAQQGDFLEAGLALIAPGDQHLAVMRSGAKLRVSLSSGPPVSRHRPSVDVMFRSIAMTPAASSAAAVLLTGMGADGALGLLELRRLGALTIAQDEATSVVFGMPGRAVDLGAAERVLPLDRIAAALSETPALRREASARALSHLSEPTS